MYPCEIIALTPAAWPDPAIAVAASRCGELGVLNLELAPTPRAALELVDRTHGFLSGQPFGVLLPGHDAALCADVAAALPAEATTIIVSLCALPAIDAAGVAAALAGFEGCGRRLLVQVSSRRVALLAARHAIGGLVLKGTESGGFRGDDGTFILLQQVRECGVPVWAQGGVGLHTAAAVQLAGAAGMVLDGELLLTRESTVPDSLKETLARFDGTGTVCLGTELGAGCRLHARAGSAELAALEGTVDALRGDGPAAATAWRAAVRDHCGWTDASSRVWPLGQDASFARGLAEQFVTVGRVIQALKAEALSALEIAREALPLAEGAPLAADHGTRYPIVQGPMTRVSDRARFAFDVAEGGALPFVALALMRGPEVRELLAETRALLGERPWGVGVLGFVPLELRQEQLAEVRACKPDFALIAGGRPDQAAALEQDGIVTYLHVPAAGLLRMFLKQGARRFVFEGRECGGHVGPLTSFVLWNTLVEILRSELPPAELAKCRLLFAGGVHDGLSAAMVSAIAAPLVEQGAQVGVLAGTAYLFTSEAVASGAIVQPYQDEAVRCEDTVLLESGPGHATRCVDTAFANVFAEQKHKLLSERLPAEQVRDALESLNIGRLRIASKGIDRNPAQAPSASKFVEVDTATQLEQGMYMIGQVATLRHEVCTIAELHADIADGSVTTLAATATSLEPGAAHAAVARPSAVAIVGMSTILPRARTLEDYWTNILAKTFAVSEVPATRWDTGLYFDADRTARDKIYSKWGGFIDPVAFDPVDYGMPPNSLHSIDPMQLLALQAAREALEDAGYWQRPFDRSRTSVILGASGGTGDLGAAYLLRSSLPLVLGEAAAAELVAAAGSGLPEWSEDSFAGLLLNVAAGRIANRFDLGGVNYVVDAACASSLAAVYDGVRELESGSSDTVVVGGIDTTQNPFGYLCFSKTQALSPTGEPRTFDVDSDGIAIAEGIAMLVLKRLADAERDGDHIYGVIQGVAGSSDGRAKGMTAPRPEGQMQALARAYAKAGIAPETVELFEAHGTGTVVGDQTEAESLSRFLTAAGAERGGAALGSVKSMIGHTKATAGAAGLVKVALALDQKILPPTRGVETPNPKAGFDQSPLYISGEARPWVARDDTPRRAGVSAFGFGGTNFHVVVEEYRGSAVAARTLARWPAELFCWAAADRAALTAALASFRDKLGTPASLAQLARDHARTRRPAGPLRLAIVAASLEELGQRLDEAERRLTADTPAGPASGVWLGEAGADAAATVAFLFPGQGSQYPDMLRDLTLHFSAARGAFERADRSLVGRHPEPLSRYVFPRPAFTREERTAQQAALTRTEVAQPALGAAAMAMKSVLARVGVRPAFAAGHSYGEYAALCAAGVFDEAALAEVSEVRGRSIVESARDGLGTMLAVMADGEAVSAALSGLDEVWIANYNAPEQTVLSGTEAGIAAAAERLREGGLKSRPLSVACGFHSPLVAPAQDRLTAHLETMSFQPPALSVFSNGHADAYPAEPGAIRARLAGHLVEPVRFTDEIRALHDAGARVFVECGPGNTLTTLTARILGDRPHHAIALDAPGGGGMARFLAGLAQLHVAGVDLALDVLFADRSPAPRIAEPTATTWMVDGGGARPLGTPAAPRISPLPLALSFETDQPPAVAAAAPVTAPDPAAATGTPARPPAPALPAAAVADDDVAAVMGRFQDLMGQFLATQQSVMMSYLEGAPADAAESLPVAAVPAPRTAAPAQPPAAAGPAADEVAPMVAAAATPAAAPAGESEAVLAAAAPTTVGLQERLLEIVSDRTGYPAEMLGLDMDLEADLGIDSIKRIEILGTFQETLGAGLEAADDGLMEQLAGARSLRAIIDEVGAHLGADAVTAAPMADATPAATDPVVDADAMTAQLLAIVSERTGYPPEMLGLDQDLEADLGIDSIKRVEILGTFQDGFDAALLAADEGLMEELAQARSLRAIVAEVMARLDGSSAAPAARSQASTPVEDAAPAAPEVAPLPQPGRQSIPVGRFRLARQACPLERSAHPLETAGLVLVTNDGEGVAARVVEALHGRGIKAAMVDHGIEPDGAAAAIGPGRYRADLTSPVATAALLALLAERHGTLAGIVHLVPLATPPTFSELDHAAWRARLAVETKGLFHLCRDAAASLTKVVPTGAACVLTATRAGLADGAATGFPGGRAVHGLVKTLALEWPQVRAKALDFGAAVASDDIAARIVDELTAGDSAVEIIFDEHGRAVRVPEAAPAETSAAPALEPGAVVLVTGGARGITALAARRLAERYAPTLVLVGRSPLPSAVEWDGTAGLTTARDIKAVLMESLRADGEPITPVNVEQRYRRLLADREVRAGLAAMKAAGARVDYRPCDVRDAEAFGALIESVYENYGRIDGVIHGAGVIEDKLLADKAADSFDRVFDTKVDSAFTLASKLAPEGLRFLVLFSSVSAAFGNRGQADYAAANEVLNGLAASLDRAWPGRVVAVDWGPWDTPGMVSEEVRRQFEARGVALIAPEVGLDRLEAELTAVGDAEVVIGGSSAWQPHAATATTSSAAFPLLGRAMPVRVNGYRELVRSIDPGHDLYLNDHRLDGRAVLPLAVATELMAETAASCWPHLQLAGVRDLAMFRGVVVDDDANPPAVRILVQPSQPLAENGITSVSVELTSADERRTPHYRAVIDLAETLPVAGEHRPVVVVEPTALGLPLDEAYRRWLFHGPLFQGIEQVTEMGPDVIKAMLRRSTPDSFLADGGGEWLIDPLLFDSALQLILLWSRRHWDTTTLPARFKAFHRYAVPTGAGIEVEAVLRPSLHAQTIHCDFHFLEAGRLIATIEDMQGNCSKALNRLAGPSASDSRAAG